MEGSQLQTWKHRCTRTNADKCRWTQGKLCPVFWADTTSRHVQKLDVCSKDFRNALYYMQIHSKEQITHYMQLYLLLIVHTCWNVTVFVASFLGSAQLSVAISTEKRERAWYLFSHEWHRDRKDGIKGLIVCGCTGPRTVKRAHVAGSLLHTSS